MYLVVGERVLDMIDRDAPDPLWDGFYATLLRLMEDGPYPEDCPDLSILPYQDPARPNAFTVEFEERALLLYQVMKDQPVIKLVDAVWG